MKYCPYCGASLVDSAVLFCTECGKQLPDPTEKETSEDMALEKPSDPQEDPEAEDGYDGYYEDVRPVDEGWQKEGLDQQLIKRILLVIAGLILAVAACIVLMYFL